MNESIRSFFVVLVLALGVFVAVPARAETAMAVGDFSFRTAAAGQESASEAKEKPKSLFGGVEDGDRSYMGLGLSWINPDGKVNGVAFEPNFGNGVGVVLYGGRELRRGFAVEFSLGLDSYEDNPGDLASLWSTLGVRLQPIEWTFSPYIYGGAGIAALAIDAPSTPPPVWWDGDVDGELAFTTTAGAGVEILLLDELAFVIEYRYRYHHGFSSDTNAHQHGVGGNFVFIGD